MYYKISKSVKGQLVNKLGSKISIFDKLHVLWHHEDGTVSDIIALHVDKFNYCGTKKWLLNVVASMKKVFKISKSRLNYNGTIDVIYDDQDVYIDKMKHAKLKPD